jgi:hypothetical protein
MGLAVACGLGSLYGFLQGAWPFGIAEAIWSVVAGRAPALVISLAPVNLDSFCLAEQIDITRILAAIGF